MSTPDIVSGPRHRPLSAQLEASKAAIRNVCFTPSATSPQTSQMRKHRPFADGSGNARRPSESYRRRNATEAQEAGIPGRLGQRVLSFLQLPFLLPAEGASSARSRRAQSTYQSRSSAAGHAAMTE